MLAYTIMTIMYIEWFSFWQTVGVHLKNAGDKEWRVMQHQSGAGWTFKDDKKFLPVTPPLSIRVDTIPVAAVGAKNNSTQIKTVIAKDVIPVGWKPMTTYYSTAA